MTAECESAYAEHGISVLIRVALCLGGLTVRKAKRQWREQEDPSGSRLNLFDAFGGGTIGAWISAERPH